MTPEQIRVFLAEPHIANIATVRPDGSPHITPVWHHFDGENLIILAEEKSVKVRNIRHEPRVSVCIATDAKPYTYVIVNGTASLSKDNIPEYVRIMAVNYLGRERGEAYTERVVKELDFAVITIKPSKMTGFYSEE